MLLRKSVQENPTGIVDALGWVSSERFGNARRHYTGNVTGISGARPVAR